MLGKKMLFVRIFFNHGKMNLRHVMICIAGIAYIYNVVFNWRAANGIAMGLGPFEEGKVSAVAVFVMAHMNSACSKKGFHELYFRASEVLWLYYRQANFEIP